MLIQMKGPNNFEESFEYEMLTALRGKIVSHLETSNARLFRSGDVANLQSRSLTALPWRGLFRLGGSGSSKLVN